MKKTNELIRLLYFVLFYSLLLIFTTITLSCLFCPFIVYENPESKTIDIDISAYWQDPQRPPSSATLTDFAFQIYQSSALLTSINNPTHDDKNAIFILGNKEDTNLIKPTGPFNILDCFIYRRTESEGGDIIIIQKVGDFDDDVVFYDWTSLENACKDINVNITIVASYHSEDKDALIRNYQKGSIYTNAHAVVRHRINGVVRRFLPRLNSCKKEPGVESGWQLEWFELKDEWLSQSYPEGYFIMYNNNHFVSISVTQSSDVPGTSSKWRQLTELINEQHIDDYLSSITYNKDDIVIYNGLYYASVINNNKTNPSNTTNWKVFHEFDNSNTVPTYGELFTLNDKLGDNIENFVKYESNGSISYYIQTAGFGNSNPPTAQNSWMWQNVKEYNEAVGVSKWQSTISYGNTNIGLIVEYDNALFRKTANWASLGVPPTENGSAWERINRWEDTQGPAYFQPGINKSGEIFYVSQTASYLATIRNTWASASYNDEYCYQDIVEYSDDLTYKGFPLYSTMPRRSDPYYFTYIVNSDETLTFYRAKQTAPVFQGVSPKEENDYWEEVIFENTHDEIATKVNGRWQIWNLVSGGNPNLYPTVDLVGINWVLKPDKTKEKYVYTIIDGMVLLWENQTVEATIPPLDTNTGESHWKLLNYRTRKPYVYTINKAGVLKFYYSPFESNTTPSKTSEEWFLLNDNIDVLDEYLYKEINGEIYYYKVVDTLQGQLINEVSNAWIGPNLSTNKMCYHYDPNTIYYEGDIVVDGTTMLNTYRYFRFRSSDNSNIGVGHYPYSSDGETCRYWESLNVFYHQEIEEEYTNVEIVVNIRCRKELKFIDNRRYKN